MEKTGKEIMSREEIKTLVDLFYEKVQNDDKLADIFNSIIKSAENNSALFMLI